MDVIHCWSTDWLDWCVGMAWLGFVRQQHLEVVVMDLAPTVQGAGEKQSKSLPKSSQFVLLQVQSKDEVFSY